MTGQLTLDEDYIDLQQFDNKADEVTGAGVSRRPLYCQPSPRGHQGSSSSDSWLYQVIRQLQAIKDLPDGWDSHGGQSPDPCVVQSACALIAALSTADPALAKPHVHPTPSGGVQFHWESGRRYFEIELVDPMTAQFYFLDREAQAETEGQLRVGDSLGAVLAFAQNVGAEP
jgi:hypothetical protein